MLNTADLGYDLHFYIILYGTIPLPLQKAPGSFDVVPIHWSKLPTSNEHGEYSIFVITDTLFNRKLNKCQSLYQFIGPMLF